MFQIILAHFNMKKDDQTCELRINTHSHYYIHNIINLLKLRLNDGMTFD